tara:strand:+ start:29 stop:550 length:522 start_codon:yes stop_codon:yes gene_type:complete
MPKVSYKDYNYDIKLDFESCLKKGEEGEYIVQTILEQDPSIEVKTEQSYGTNEKLKWTGSGNIAIEIENKMKKVNGKMQICQPYKSGLSKTKAGTWIHLLSYRDIILGGYILPIKELRRRLKELKKEEKIKDTWGGDNKASRLLLVKIKDIFDYSPQNLTNAYTEHQMRQPFL